MNVMKVTMSFWEVILKRHGVATLQGQEGPVVGDDLVVTRSNVDVTRAALG
jgi:hypothetical protein